MQTDQSKPERETIICTCSLDGQVRAEQRRLDAQRLLAVADPPGKDFGVKAIAQCRGLVFFLFSCQK